MSIEVNLSFSVLNAQLFLILNDVLQLKHLPDLMQTACLFLSLNCLLRLISSLFLLGTVSSKFLHRTLVHLMVDFQHRKWFIFGLMMRAVDPQRTSMKNFCVMILKGKLFIWLFSSCAGIIDGFVELCKVYGLYFLLWNCVVILRISMGHIVGNFSFALVRFSHGGAFQCLTKVIVKHQFVELL